MPRLGTLGLLAAALLPSLLGHAEAHAEAPAGAALRGSAAVRGGRRLHHNVETRHASAHLGYTSPLQSGQPVGWYNSLTPKHSSESTFFATNTQGFGYMGLQQVEERGVWFQGTAIFSIWDAGCAEVMDPGACPLEQQAEIVECGEMAICSRFGNEGTGYRSMIRFDEWELEQSYGFLVQAFWVSETRVRYDGYFHAPELGGWVLLSKIQVNMGSRPWYLHSLGSFVEQWDERSGEDVRWARFGPAFVEAQGALDAWTQIRRSTFSHTSGAAEDTTHVHGNVTNFGQQWGMGIGGDLVKGVVQHTTLELSSASPVPAELSEFSALRRNGQLPTGCLGGTCTGTLIKGWLQDAFSKKYFPITACVMVLLLCCCCSAVRSCLLRRRASRSPSIQLKAPPAAAPHAAPGSKPAPVQALDAAVQGVVDPICQGAAVVAEQVAQAFSPAASRAGSPASRAASPAPGLAERVRSRSPVPSRVSSRSPGPSRRGSPVRDRAGARSPSPFLHPAAAQALDDAHLVRQVC